MFLFFKFRARFALSGSMVGIIFGAKLPLLGVDRRFFMLSFRFIRFGNAALPRR